MLDPRIFICTGLIRECCEQRLIERVRETYDYNLEVFDRVEAKSIKFLLNLKDKVRNHLCVCHVCRLKSAMRVHGLTDALHTGSKNARARSTRQHLCAFPLNLRLTVCSFIYVFPPLCTNITHSDLGCHCMPRLCMYVAQEALEKLKEAIQEMGLPSDIKNNAVRSFMKLRRKRYLEEMVVYEINTRLYHKQFEKREIMVARIMEFTGNSNEDEIKELTARLSGGTITFVEKPKPVRAFLLAIICC